MDERVDLDWAGWGERARFTHYPSGKTLLRQPYMLSQLWARRVREYLVAYPGVPMTVDGQPSHWTTDAWRLMETIRGWMGEYSPALRVGQVVGALDAGHFTVQIEGERLAREARDQAVAVRAELVRQVELAGEVYGYPVQVTLLDDGGAELVVTFAEVGRE